LHVGEKEDEPVEPALALARRFWFGRGSLRRRRNVAVIGRPPAAITVIPFDPMEWTRDQTRLL
jgi:hypothetical protein